MHVKIKNKPRLSLATMLKRKRRPLKNFLAEAGITSYASLVKYCDAQGIDAISENEYKKHAQIVSDPSEGIIVLEVETLEDATASDEAGEEKKRKPRKNALKQLIEN